MSDNEQRQAAEPAPYPRDVELLLREIEKEPVPERLLVLATELQAALTKQRQAAGRAEQ